VKYHYVHGPSFEKQKTKSTDPAGKINADEFVEFTDVSERRNAVVETFGRNANRSVISK